MSTAHNVHLRLRKYAPPLALVFFFANPIFAEENGRLYLSGKGPKLVEQGDNARKKFDETATPLINGSPFRFIGRNAGFLNRNFPSLHIMLLQDAVKQRANSARRSLDPDPAIWPSYSIEGPGLFAERETTIRMPFEVPDGHFDVISLPNTWRWGVTREGQLTSFHQLRTLQIDRRIATMERLESGLDFRTTQYGNFWSITDDHEEAATIRNDGSSVEMDYGIRDISSSSAYHLKIAFLNRDRYELTPHRQEAGRWLLNVPAHVIANEIVDSENSPFYEGVVNILLPLSRDFSEHFILTDQMAAVRVPPLQANVLPHLVNTDPSRDSVVARAVSELGLSLFSQAQSDWAIRGLVEGIISQISLGQVIDQKTVDDFSRTKASQRAALEVARLQAVAVEKKATKPWYRRHPKTWFGRANFQ